MRFLAFFTLIFGLFLTSCNSSNSSPTTRVYDVAASDPEMLATVKEARATLSQFLETVQHHDSSSYNFAVKMPFTDGERPEYIWLGEPAFKNGKWYGTVDNTPDYTHAVKEGERVSFDPTQVTDWNYTRNGELMGGYSIRLLRSRMTPEERAEFDKSTGWTIK